MDAESLRTLESGINKIIRPEMEGRGFSHEGACSCEHAASTFRRQCGECIQIVQFQAGDRTLAGTFTVNLAVYHPQYCEPALLDLRPEQPYESHCLMDFRLRLSVLRFTPLIRFYRNRPPGGRSFLGWWLTGLTDKWWRLTPDDAQLSRDLSSVRGLLLSRGLAWLDQNSDVALLKAVRAQFPPRPRVAP